MFKTLTYSIFKVLGSLFGLWLVFELLSHLVVESLWFKEVGYLHPFLKRLLWQFGLFSGTTGVSLWFLLNNLYKAQYYQWHAIPTEFLNLQKRRYKENRSDQTQKNYQTLFPESPSFGLSLLLTLVFFLGTMMGLMLLYYSQVAYDIWTPDLTLPNITPSLPLPFYFNSIPKLFSQIFQHLWKAVAIGGLILLILLKKKFYLKTMSIIFSIIFGLVISGNWTRIIQYFNSTPFSTVDPQFGRDISFYVFKLQFWKLLNFWLGGLFLYGFATVSLTYLLSAKSLSQGRFPGFSRHQLRHLYLLGGLTCLIAGLRHWLNRYELLYSPRGVVYGASYTDVHVSLPVDTTLCILVTMIAVWLLFKALTGRRNLIFTQLFRNKNRPYFPFYTLPFILYLVIFILGLFATAVVQSFVVQPNELGRERPYIERSIALTRAAFNLDKIKIETLDATGSLTDEDLQDNRLTIKNIRLWDARPLLQTNRQLQQIRLYYKFPDADIDRYRIPIDNECLSPNVAKQQVLIAARELDYNEVPKQAKTWVNKHLIYTHGYGFTLSLVNQVDQGGLPFYLVQDIETNSNAGELQTSNANICNSIPINNPRIYFGELTDTYIMTNTEVQELDYPSGQDNAYNIYDGQGGISISSAVRRLLFAEYLKDWQMLFTKNFTPQTRLLFHRDINRRIRKIAPFLHFDNDSYLVSAKLDKSNSNRLISPSTLYWIIDAYTTSSGYPYSDPGKYNFNYIRNSVKIVIDAYNGNVQFYVVDPSDPLIQTWQRIFPDLFKPLAEMPTALKAHIRYPKDLFNTQSERLLTYHMTDAQVFYNREDQWRIPQEIYGEKQQPIEPYYLLMRVTGKSQEFILINFFTPTSRNNLIAGLFAQSDGQNYGKLNLIQLPKQRVIYGPEQIEALINQDPVISQQISLWNRQGSRVIQGNLLVIPFFAEQSLLYVEPLYLEAEQNSLPTLARVIVIYENKIVMAQNLDKALQSIFEPSQSTPETIIRSLTEEERRASPELK
ncbi:UPF0182 family protein [Cyanobacterium sp. uoEpiScrs1]|uniref:UPF0182 family protein n=1 Tax=Cyanobacterium sp. uoEpiScrs1 TaxID=2976343 RepID=UPI00226AE5F7|nr:UPF0182 family protein [Cyanobacterium sp. uoEpiScrs1]